MSGPSALIEFRSTCQDCCPQTARATRRIGAHHDHATNLKESCHHDSISKDAGYWDGNPGAPWNSLVEWSSDHDWRWRAMVSPYLDILFQSAYLARASPAHRLHSSHFLSSIDRLLGRINYGSVSVCSQKAADVIHGNQIQEE